MSVRETLDKLENMVVGASHFPFTEKTLINDNDLIHYVEELRNDLPKELNRADEIMRNHDNRLIIVSTGFLKELQNFLACLRVKISCRFVSQQNGRLIYNSSGNCNSLLFPTGQFLRERFVLLCQSDK
mgnify:CR=1 FL=1